MHGHNHSHVEDLLNTANIFIYTILGKVYIIFHENCFLHSCPHSVYFVSPRERPRRQRVVQNKKLVIARITSVFSPAFKKESWDWCTKDAFCSVYFSTCWVTSQSFSRWDKVLYPLRFEFMKIGGEYMEIQTWYYCMALRHGQLPRHLRKV